jgi:hypothetical protein
MNLTQNRAAVICLGGWGLQVMLHLNPRLQAIQQQRYFTDVNRNAPSLRDVTRVVTCMPRTHYPASDVHGSVSYQMLDMYRPNVSLYPTSLELEQIAQRPILDISDRTYGEAFAEAMCRDAIDRHWIERMSYTHANDIATVINQEQSGYRVERSEYMKYMLQHADTIATWLQRDLIEPTLLDRIAPSESLLQTNIYIVASLTEPLTSVMIWPLLVGLKRVLGTGRISQVTGIFNIGSFAVEQHIALEASCVHVALSELEILMGTGVASKYPELRSTLSDNDNFPDFARFREYSHEVLDQIYLLDRNKENFSLSASSAENAIIATNFIEASLVSQLPQAIAENVMRRNTRQYNLDAEQHKRMYITQNYPYSSFGAYIRNVPLMEYLMQATSLQSSELRKKLQGEDEQILSREQQDFLGSFQLTYSSLQQVLIEQTSRLNLLFDSSAFPPFHQRILNWVGNQRAFIWLRSWLIQSGWMSDQTATELNRVQMPLMSENYYTRDLADISHLSLFEQRTRLIRHRQTVRTQLDADINPRFFEMTWGTDFIGLHQGDDNAYRFTNFEEAHQLNSGIRSLTWTERALYDRRARLFPTVVASVMQHIQGLVTSNPRGLAQSLAYVRGFLSQVVRRRHDGVGDAQILANQLQYSDSQLDRDQRRWDEQMAGYQRRMMSWQYVATQAFMMSIVVVLTVLLYIQQTAPQSDVYLVVGILSMLVLTVFVSWFVWMGIQRLRARRLMSQLLRIHIQHMTNHVNIIVNNGISQLYGNIENYLTQILDILESTMQHTFEGYIERNEQTINNDIVDSHVREVIRNEQLYQEVNSFVSQQVRTDKMTNTAWFEENWANDSFAISRPLNRIVVSRTFELYFNIQMVRLVCEARALVERYNGQTIIPAEYTSDPEYIAARDRNALLGATSGICVISNLSVSVPHQVDACKVCVRHCALRQWNDESFQQVIAQRRYATLILQTLAQYNFYDGLDGHIERTLSYLYGKDGSLKRDMTFTNQVKSMYNLEYLLGSMYPSERQIDLEVERMTRHAKTNINFETVDAQNVIETRHVILDYPEQSSLSESFERRRFTPITGGDPFNLAVIRTNHMLQRKDFPSCEDAHIHFSQIASSDQIFIVIPAFRSCYDSKEHLSAEQVTNGPGPFFTPRPRTEAYTYAETETPYETDSESVMQDMESVGVNDDIGDDQTSMNQSPMSINDEYDE